MATRIGEPQGLSGRCLILSFCSLGKYSNWECCWACWSKYEDVELIAPRWKTSSPGAEAGTGFAGGSGCKNFCYPFTQYSRSVQNLQLSKSSPACCMHWHIGWVNNSISVAIDYIFDMILNAVNCPKHYGSAESWASQRACLDDWLGSQTELSIEARQDWKSPHDHTQASVPDTGGNAQAPPEILLASRLPSLSECLSLSLLGRRFLFVVYQQSWPCWGQSNCNASLIYPQMPFALSIGWVALACDLDE